MKGIDEEFIPKFKFFKINKSTVKSSMDIHGYTDLTEKKMICFIDISQKILYDTSKAEGELLSLINSTISHEMRNPLNSIINQCKIIQILSI
jgi:signal transduction histidine kinase